jgi:DNA-binding NtrC family response regulator
VLLVTAFGSLDTAREAMRLGAFDYLSKPFGPEELTEALKKAIRSEGHLKAEAPGDAPVILTQDPALSETLALARRAADSKATILIQAESGTGKELLARLIHQASPRRSGPFVAINCAAIPETLLESELFGHEKGAFTGAHAQRKGRIETAEGGTLFLDELGEIPLMVQVKLLRFLQERKIERVGGRGEIEVDTRVLAATNVDLTKAMAAGTFREDLYYRLAVVRIDLPALRDRQDDVLLLAQTFLKVYGEQCGKTGLSFSPQAIRAIQRHPWPGNVRELQNRVRRAIIMCGGKRLNPDDLELSAAGEESGGVTLRAARDELERGMVERALRKHGGKVSAAAAELDVSRPTFYELMDRLGIKRAE